MSLYNSEQDPPKTFFKTIINYKENEMIAFLSSYQS